MIEVRMGDQNCIDVMTNVPQSLGYTIWIRFDPFVQRSGPQTNAGEIRVDKQRVVVGFEFKAVHAEISDADRLGRCRPI